MQVAPALSLFTTLCLTTALAAQAPGTGIGTPGSPHNFVDNIGFAETPSVGGWNVREELCRVCHVPHDHDRAQRFGDNGLLWNHALSSATYTMYTSATLDGTTASQPTGYSKLCLGCHDGTVGIDTFDKYPGGTVFMDDYNNNFLMPGPSYNFNFNSTHPISVVYDETLDPNLLPKNTPFGTSGTIEDVLEGGSVVQCSSCHDVHDQAGEVVPFTHLLRVEQRASFGSPSGLCLSCHIK